MPSDEVLHSLIQLIYEAAIDPDKWPAFLRNWAQAVGAQSAAVVVQDLKGGNGSIEANVGFDPECLRTYRNYYAALNPWVARSEHLFVPGTIVNCDSLISAQELTRTEFYADWLRPYDYLHSYGGAITRKDGMVSYITAMRSRQAGLFEEEQIELLRFLMPHLECAARLHVRVANVRAQLTVARDALDLLNRGVIMTDANGRILLTNAAAEKILSGCDGLKRSGDRLTALAVVESKRLSQMIASAGVAAGGYSMDGGSVLPISRPSGGRPLEAFICPMQSRNAGWLKISGVLVLITSPDDSGELSCQALSDLFGLTPAEARLARALGSGATLSDAADSFGISRETVRTQLKSIFLKTGTNSQSDLARLLSASSARLHRRKKCD